MKHFYYTVFVLTLLITCSVGLSSCRRCKGSTDEPLFRVRFFRSFVPANTEYVRVYGVDHNNQARPDLSIDEQLPFFELPLSVVADKVTYVFEKGDQSKDTLILNYTRRFAIEDPKCGAEVFLDDVFVSRQSTLIPRNSSDYQNIQTSNKNVFEIDIDL